MPQLPVALILAALVAGIALRHVAPVPVHAGADESAKALQAAMFAFNGVPASQCTADGQFPPPGRDTCLSVRDDRAAQAGRGLVAVQAFLAPNVQPLFALVGRGADGEWGLWFATPAAYVPVQLPSEARVCGADGVAVRASPFMGSEMRATLPADAVVSVDRFLLARPGTWRQGEGGTRGDGWYHLAGSLDGWVEARSVVTADAECGMVLR